MIVQIDAEDKIKALGEYYFTRIRGKQYNGKVNQIDKSHFTSCNSSLSRLGTAAYPLC